MKGCVLQFTGGSKFIRLRIIAILSIIVVFSTSIFADAGLVEFNSGNYQKALELWRGELKKNKNSAEINYNVAMLFDKGLGVDADESIAEKHYLKAAKKNYAPAMFKLGVIMTRQDNYPAAAKWWLKASNSQIPEAQYNLAKLYRDGVGVEKDLYRAKYWFKKAAESAMQKYKSLTTVAENTNNLE